MIIEIVLGQVFWLNVFPNKYVVSKTMRPLQIMYGLKIDYHCRSCIDCGQYVQTHEKNGKNMMENTVGDITLRPTGNWQGGYYLYSIPVELLILPHWHSPTCDAPLDSTKLI